MYLKKLESETLVKVNLIKKRIKWDKAPSKGQQVLQDFLFPMWNDNIVCAEWYIPGSKLRIDIINFTKRMCLEYSPKSHHGNFNKFFHRNAPKYFQAMQRDYDKVTWCEDNNFKLLELDEEDVTNLSIAYFKKKFDVNIV